MRLPYYQGAMQAVVLAEQEGGGRSRTQRQQAAPDLSPEGVDMRHNQAAAKAAARGLKNDDGEVKYVPAGVFLGLPEVQAEYVQVS